MHTKLIDLLPLSGKLVLISFAGVRKMITLMTFAVAPVLVPGIPQLRPTEALPQANLEAARVPSVKLTRY